MALEIIDESDTIKAGNKEKKTALVFVDESDIKKVGNQEKKSWSDIIESEVSEMRKDPVQESDTRKVGGQVKRPGLEFIAKERIVSCERQKMGMTNDCVLCRELSKEIFDRCTNKYGGY